MSAPRRTVLLLAALSAVSLASFGAYALTRTAAPAPVPDSGDAQWEESGSRDDDIPEHYIRRKLDGAYVEPAEADIYPIAAMIDNDPHARLQSGLAHAQVVYEVKAEAGITRFMALFAAAEQLEEIGPVRSARPYFVRWAQGYDALYAHVGGSPEALEYLRGIGLESINEFYNGTYFRRSDAKFAPHNVYTSTENLRTYLERLDAENDGYRSWRYKKEALATATAQNITINYSVSDFLVEWQYDAERNAWRRHMGNAAHNDADGTPIYAKNILIMQVSATVVDEEFRRHMANIGEGFARYCLDGACHEGGWKKESATAREVFYDENGEEVRLNGGATWVQVVQGKGEVEIK